MNSLKILLTIFAALVINSQSAYGQTCQVKDQDIVQIDGIDYIYLSKDRSRKIKDDLALYKLEKERTTLLEAKNKELTSQLVFLKDQLDFYQKQVSLLLSESKPKQAEIPTMYPVVGAFILGNLTSSLAFGYWSSQISRVK